MYKVVAMSDAESESEYTDHSKSPILGRTLKPAKRRVRVRKRGSRKNKFQGTNRRRKYLCLAVAALAIICLLAVFISISDNNNTDNYRTSVREGATESTAFPRRKTKSIALLNFQRDKEPTFHNLRNNCSVTIWDAAQLEDSRSYDAIVINSTLDDILSGRELINVNPNDSLIIFGSDKPLQYSNSGNISLANSHLRIYDKIFSYSLKSDFIYQPFKIWRKNDSKIMSPNLQPEWDAPQANFTSQQLRNFRYESVLDSSPLALTILNGPCHVARKELIERITQNMDVHTYGECGEYSCGEDLCKYIPRSRGNKTYKFFLAFEEELCEDYVGESFFKALGFSLLPVVFGGANYTRFAPPNSYINARDYASIRELTEYLLYLDQNPEEHIKYFTWQEKYYLLETPYDFRDICEYLTNADKVKLELDALKATNTTIAGWLNENKCRPYELPEAWTS
ncbi:uncharacterized protein LOC105226449 [Bactrocera dorsalis]|uniref:Fucosyltransferase n=1 Tax=Bactrocera dorsalis TaxID=27457 RepID=A0A6I9V3Q1_BACDO|nr:uncharacterized protein LOC105226449 [Bactrocera dorsalis]